MVINIFKIQFLFCFPPSSYKIYVLLSIVFKVFTQPRCVKYTNAIFFIVIIVFLRFLKIYQTSARNSLCFHKYSTEFIKAAFSSSVLICTVAPSSINLSIYSNSNSRSISLCFSHAMRIPSIHTS